MLKITEGAALAITGLVEMSTNPADAGLRIASRVTPEGDDALELTISEEPAYDDVIVTFEDNDARVYLDPTLAPEFETKVLHAEERDGRVRFVIAEQIRLEEPSRNGDGPHSSMG
jgi:Fe-S cluster assembly iron-binding protein IscA